MERVKGFEPSFMSFLDLHNSQQHKPPRSLLNVFALPQWFPDFKNYSANCVTIFNPTHNYCHTITLLELLLEVQDLIIVAPAAGRELKILLSMPVAAW